MLYCWYSHWKIQYEDFREFGHQPGDSTENFKKESLDDYEDMIAQKSYSDHSDKKKRIPKFFDDIQVMINKDPSKSISSIIRNMELPEF